MSMTEDQLFGSVEPIEIQEEMERSFLDYAMSVIVARALPDARDGLKPVHRRILYGMHDMGARNDRPHMKCARVTGDVMGKYHPHGDGAIYDALVRMAQSFSLRHPLIDGHGNFGSPDDPPAAARYTECRLAPVANSLLESIDEDTVDFADNYSGEFTEPVVLPARFPNLLVNGSQGIAVGMATNIPPHNMGEVIDATAHLIDNPEATAEELMKFVKGPDFPTGGFILGTQGIKDALTTGRGSIKMRAKAEIDEGKRGAVIVVSEIPYQTSVGSIAARIAELVNSRELDGIRNVNDESAQGLTKLVIELKRDANANVVLNNLYKHTALQTSFGVNMVALVDGVPRTLNLAQALNAYVGHQIEVIRRRSQFRLEKAKARAHIVEGLVKALDMIDAIVETIKASADRDKARIALMKEPYKFSEIQANHILDMTLSRLTRLGRKQLDDELAELKKTIAELESILADDKKVRAVIKKELADWQKKFATERVCKIVRDEGDIDVLDLIEDEPIVITMTRSGYIKATALDSFRTQGRGGRGVKGAKLKEEDIVSDVIYTTAHTHLLFFTNKGKIYRLKAHEVPQKERTARGMNIVNLLSLAPNEKVQAIVETKEFGDDQFLFFGTKQGQVKKTAFSEYDKSRRDGFIAINLRDGDELVRVVVTGGNDNILMVTKMGQGIRFSENDVRPMGRGTAGVRGMKLKAGDQVVSLDVARDDEHILITTSAGYGKRTKVEKFNPQGRGGQGVRAIRINEKKGTVVSAFLVTEDDELFAVSSSGVAIRTNAADISEQGRDATGVKVMNVEKGTELVTAAPIRPHDVD